ncbi:plasma-membrane choline transporter-domain-containing protein [Zopfochytrium polystomum]|nr:plasma-membrane choline transporter-domain-containing protein [Zopfochytrium polystomum]
MSSPVFRESQPMAAAVQVACNPEITNLRKHVRPQCADFGLGWGWQYVFYCTFVFVGVLVTRLLALKTRSCHDAAFLILLIAFWVGMWIIASTAVAYGDPKRLLLPSDSLGNTCGTNTNANGTDLSDKPNLFYLNPANPLSNPSVCVANCPNSTAIASVESFICSYGVMPSSATLVSLTTSFQCAPLLYQSQPVAGRCMPQDDTLRGQMESVISAVGQIDKITHDVVVCWPVFLGAVFVAMVVALLWVVLLRFVAKEMVWTTIFAVNLAVGGIALFLYLYWQNRQYYYSYSTEVGHDMIQVQWEIYAAQAGTYIFAVLFVLLVIITIFMRKKIMIACEIVKETSEAIGKMPFDATSGRLLVIYHILGSFWGLCFLQGVNQLTIAGAFASYYWTMDKSNLPPRPVTRSLYRTVRYHLGSVALGSLLIAVVQTIRVLTWVSAKQVAKTRRRCLIWIFGCLNGLLAMLHRVVKFINKNAYIKIAIDGQAFCAACGSAMGLIVRNGLKLVAVSFVAEYVLTLSTLCVTMVTVLIFYGILSSKKDSLELNFIFVPLLIVGLEAFLIGVGFLSVYRMGIDTIFLSFLEDGERNDGSAERPFFMTPRLQSVIDVSNKAMVEEKKKKSKQIVPRNAVEEF